MEGILVKPMKMLQGDERYLWKAARSVLSRSIIPHIKHKVFHGCGWKTKHISVWRVTNLPGMQRSQIVWGKTMVFDIKHLFIAQALHPEYTVTAWGHRQAYLENLQQPPKQWNRCTHRHSYTAPFSNRGLWFHTIECARKETIWSRD